MTSRSRKSALIIAAALVAAMAVITIFGRHTKVAESIKQQTAAILKKEYIPDQHVDVATTMAYQKLDSVYNLFRKNFRMHYQTIGTASFPDSSRIILIAEPAPFLESDSVEAACKQFTHQTSQHHFKIGYDGRVTDMAIVLGNATTENLDNIVTRLSKQQYLSDYKPRAHNLLESSKRHYFTQDDLDYQITLGEFDDWFFTQGETFIDEKDTAHDITVEDMFHEKRRGVFFSRAPGLVAWCIRRNSDIGKQAGDIRRFALDADLILGALRDSATLVIIGREREVPLEVLPPLRVETVLLVASISSKELSQSLDINDCMAGKMANGRDWCPTYLSRELENTELGHLLTITDILLKDWSESGTIQEASYHYPSPGYFPFDKPLFKKLGLNELVYNWNTANTMYAIDLPEHTIYTLNRTGALPVSYCHSHNMSAKPATISPTRATPTSRAWCSTRPFTNSSWTTASITRASCSIQLSPATSLTCWPSPAARYWTCSRTCPTAKSSNSPTPCRASTSTPTVRSRSTNNCDRTSASTISPTPRSMKKRSSKT